MALLFCGLIRIVPLDKIGIALNCEQKVALSKHLSLFRDDFSYRAEADYISTKISPTRFIYRNLATLYLNPDYAIEFTIMCSLLKTGLIHYVE